MTVVIVKPGYAPYEAEINGLHEMQEVVGGTIQAIYPFADRSAVVCNDEGILLGMPFNRSMPGGYGGVFGPFFVCGLGEEDFCSLTPEQVKAYKKEFHCAEILIGAAGNKVAVGSAMEIMTAMFSICGGIVQSIMGSIGGMSSAGVTMPQEIIDAIEEVGFLQSVPLWMVTFLGSLFITVLSFILIMTVYGRFFRLYMFTALAPLPLASFAGEDTSFMGKAFLKSYIGVCMEGAVVVLACLIFSAFASSGAPIVDTSLPVVTMSWQYVAQTIFNMLILVALIKGAERIAKEMFGL